MFNLRKLMKYKYAMEKKDNLLLEKVKKINQNCAKLVAEGIISEADNYAKLRRDTVQVRSGRLGVYFIKFHRNWLTTKPKFKKRA